jgi:hypothetical protein
MVENTVILRQDIPNIPVQVSLSFPSLLPLGLHDKQAENEEGYTLTKLRRGLSSTEAWCKRRKIKIGE